MIRNISQESQIYLIVALIIGFLVHGCAFAPQEQIAERTAQRLVGKSRADILRCGGKPLHEISHGAGQILRYYKEAPMFEESRPFLKGSQPGVHHGCWARLLIENNQVTGVEFRTVPEGVEPHDDECEDIFQEC